MGDGANLKRILEKKNTNIRKVSMAIGVSPTTLYSIVQEDRSIRLELAVLIASELDIAVEDICSVSNLMSLNSESLNQIKYNNFYSKLAMFGTDRIGEVENLLRMYYKLDDVGRNECLKIIHVLLESHMDENRKKEIDGYKYTDKFRGKD